MSYVIKRRSGRAPSSSGGKDYHLVAVRDSITNQGFLITRWAKAGQWGNGLKVRTTTSERELEGHFNSYVRSKFHREYREELGKSITTVDTIEELKSALGLYWASVVKNVDWLSDDEVAAPTIADPTPAAPTLEERIKENSSWGSW
jgi:hypothetical protein